MACLQEKVKTRHSKEAHHEGPGPTEGKKNHSRGHVETQRISRGEIQRQNSSRLMEPSPFLNQHSSPPQFCPNQDWAASSYCRHPGQEKRAWISKSASTQRKFQFCHLLIDKVN